MSLETVTSADGTEIAFERMGEGPAVILVGGALHNRFNDRRLAELLSPEFTAYFYDRRGRGDSTDTAPYAMEREYEDLQALIDLAGGEAFVYGHSAGAQLSLQAVAAGVPMRRLAVYEPPYEGTGIPKSQQLPDAVRAAVAAGDPETAVEHYLAILGTEGDSLAVMKAHRSWPRLVAVGHTLPYDMQFVNKGLIPYDNFRSIQTPVLVLNGTPVREWLDLGLQVLADTIPGARREQLEGEPHMVSGAALAPVLREFFTVR